jgi:hypothetical protein
MVKACDGRYRTKDCHVPTRDSVLASKFGALAIRDGDDTHVQIRFAKAFIASLEDGYRSRYRPDAKKLDFRCTIC